MDTDKSDSWWGNLRGESFLRLVLLRGFVQFGLSAVGIFLLFSLVRGDPELELHAKRAVLAFPLLGLLLGTLFWLAVRIFARRDQR